jgi:hypothetical protein
MPSAGKTKARGYGAKHKRHRQPLARQVAAGTVNCARCGYPIEPGADWDLGHTDDRTGYQGPEHRACNRSSAAAAGEQAEGEACGPYPRS